jgi:hypothetical protein
MSSPHEHTNTLNSPTVEMQLGQFDIAAHQLPLSPETARPTERAPVLPGLADAIRMGAFNDYATAAPAPGTHAQQEGTGRSSTAQFVGLRTSRRSGASVTENIAPGPNVHTPLAQEINTLVGERRPLHRTKRILADVAIKPPVASDALRPDGQRTLMDKWRRDFARPEVVERGPDRSPEIAHHRRTSRFSGLLK